MEKLNLKKSNLYVIEVNDNGDTIEFNLDDIELPLKLEMMQESMQKISDHMKAQELIIDKQQDVARKGGLLTKNELEKAKLISKTYNDTRDIMDKFLGEGACKKIFGDINYATMWDDLMTALEPHLEKMKLKRESLLDSVKKKYSVNDNEELS